MRRTLILLACGMLLPLFAQAGGPYQFYSITPCRLVDTRGSTGINGGPILSSETIRSFAIDVAPANCGIPSTAAAAALNFVIVSAQGGGHLTVWPRGLSMPVASTINFDPGEPAIANGAIVPLTTDSTANISVWLGTGGPQAHLVIDANGYFQ